MKINGIPVALQLYSVREACQEDLLGTLKAIADMGYEGVDFAGTYGYSAEEIRDMLDDLGLEVAGCHTGIDTLLEDDFMPTVTYWETVGNQYLIVPGLPPMYRETRDDWLRTAELFNNLANKLESFDMYTGYHNHMIEFEPYPDGMTPWDVLYSNTDARVVMQIDIGNALHGGGDPVAYLERYPFRAKTVHLKDYAADREDVILGEGDVNWQEIFEIVRRQNVTDWYIVEQETYPYPPMESVKRAIDNLKKMQQV